MTVRFQRYVAIGDSTSEGMDDPDGRGGYRGWADRLSERIAGLQNGELLYANLAIRGRVTRQIRDEQLARAVAMRPDLATISAGMNDLMRRHFDARSYGADVEAMQQALRGIGATVIAFTLPDMSDVTPLGRFIAPRLVQLNDELRRASTNTGALLLDLDAYPVAGDPRLWSDDRLHANSVGHARIADALAYVLGLPGTDASWGEPLPSPPPPTAASIVRAELAWGRRHLLPWIWRHMRGKSSGDGREAKRPELARFG
jgi:lysophospholipase L1-like esterase